MRIAITGADGFIGRHAVARLASSENDIHAVTRGPAEGGHAGVRVLQVRGLDDYDGLMVAFRGCDAVVHLAGRAHVTRERVDASLREFRRVNVAGTATCLDAAMECGVPRFLLLSSVAAVAGPDAGTVSEDATPSPTTPYGVSKLEAEQLVRERAERVGLAAPILRPPMVYGPGMKGNPLRLFQLVAAGLPLPFAAIRNNRSMLFVGNLVRAIEAALQSPNVARETMFVTDGESLSTPDLVRRAARAMGRPATMLPVPPPVLHAVGRIGDALAGLLPMPLTLATVRSLTGTLLLDDTRIRTATGYRPIYTVDQGLRESAEWFLAARAARR